MKRCVVRFNKGEFCNIEATMLCREDSVVFVYNGTELVAMFDLGYIDAIWMNEKGDGKRDEC